MAEVLTAQQFPDIIWSKYTDPESDTDSDTYGLISLASPKQHLRLRFSGTLQTPDPLWRFKGDDSILTFGSELYVMAIARSNKIISLDDAEWINQVGQEVRSFMQRFYQLETAKKIILQSEQLKVTVRGLTISADPDITEDAGIIEELVNRQGRKDLPSKIAFSAKRLKELEVTEFGEKFSTWTPDWVLEHIHRFSEVA